MTLHTPQEHINATRRERFEEAIDRAIIGRPGLFTLVIVALGGVGIFAQMVVAK